MKTLQKSSSFKNFSNTPWYSIFLSVFLTLLHVLFVWMVFFPTSLSAKELVDDHTAYTLRTNGDYYGNDGCLLFHIESGKSTRTLWNRNGQLMPKGKLAKAENSNSLTSQWIVTLPDNNKVFYLFTTDGVDQYGNSGLRYNIIDMDAGGGQGDITSSGCLLFSSTQAIAVIPHSHGTGQWILAHKPNSDVFVEYSLTSQGISQKAVFKMGNVTQFWTGELCASTDGRKLVYAGLNWTSLFDFDNSSGRLSNAVDIGVPSYSAIFSHSGHFLYLAHTYNRTMYQTDVQSAAGKYKLLAIGTCGRNGVKSISRETDGRIYVSNWDRGAYVGVIADPERKGTSCDYRPNCRMLPTNIENAPAPEDAKVNSSNGMMLSSK